MKISNYLYRKIDKGIRNTIMLLNEKNYITTICCEGHAREGVKSETYICFEKDYDFEVEPPKGYTYNDNRLSYFFDECQEEDRQEVLCKLFEWSKSLPIIEEEKRKPIYMLLAKDSKGLIRTLYYGNEKGDYEKIKKNRSRWYHDFEEKII